MYHWGNNDRTSGPWYGFGRMYSQGYLEDGKVFFCPYLRLPADIRRVYWGFNGSIENCTYLGDGRTFLSWDETERRLSRNGLNTYAGLYCIMSSYPLLLNYNPHSYPEGQYPEYGPKGWKWAYCEQRGNLSGRGGMAISVCSYEFWSLPDSRIIPRNHKDGTNVLYLDSHVEWLTTRNEPLPYVNYLEKITPFDR